MKKQKGITLIALVITIIVLLILAGVSISMVIGNNGILNQASKAAVDTKAAEEKEQAELQNLVNEMDNWVTPSEETKDYSYLFNFDKTTGTILGIKQEHIAGNGTEYYIGTDDSSYGYLKSDYYQEGGCVLKENIDTLIVPSEIDGAEVKTVKYIGALNVKKLVFESGITSIEGCYDMTRDGNYSDYNFSSETQRNSFLLEEIVFPNTLVNIGNAAFIGCYKLKSITIPDSLTSIESNTFGACSGLTSITIGKNVSNISNYSFAGCVAIEKIVVAEGNTKYDSRENCNAIIDTATNQLVYGCKNTTIPNSITSIGNYAFNNCSGLTNIAIPNSITSIGDCAFNNCSGLTNITIPDSVTSIGVSAFCNCIGLTNITIPKSVTNIGKYAFQYCDNLKEVRFEMTTAPTFGSDCFYRYQGSTITTFYFKNATVDSKFTTSHYKSSYGTKSTNYSW